MKTYVEEMTEGVAEAIAECIRRDKPGIVLKPITIHLIPYNDGEEFFITFPLWALWSMYISIQQIGLRATSILTAFGASTQLRRGGDSNPDVLQDAIYVLQDQLEIIHKFTAAAKPRPDKKEDLQCFTYTLLQQKRLTYAEAAAFASTVLQKQVSSDAWRMHITRWAEKRQLPKIGKQRRANN